MNLKSFLFILSFFVFKAQMSAQITTGSMDLAITDVSMNDLPGDDTNGEVFTNMMKNMKMTLHFNPEVQVTEMSMMGTMNIKQFMRGGNMEQYMDMMGQKMLVKSGIEQFQKMGVNPEEMKDLYKIEKFKDDKKELLGFDCYRVEVSFDMSKFVSTNEEGEDNPFIDQMKEVTMSIYLTEAIKLNNFNLNQFQMVELDGAPLSTSIDMGMMKMTVEAVSFSKDVPASAFEMPTGEYREF